MGIEHAANQPYVSSRDNEEEIDESAVGNALLNRPKTEKGSGPLVGLPREMDNQAQPEHGWNHKKPSIPLPIQHFNANNPTPSPRIIHKSLVQKAATVPVPVRDVAVPKASVPPVPANTEIGSIPPQEEVIPHGLSPNEQAAIRDEIFLEVMDKVRTGIATETYGKMNEIAKKEVDFTLKNKTQAACESWLKSRFRPQIKSELKEEISTTLHDALLAEVKNDVRAELAGEIKQEILAKVGTDLKAAVVTDLRASVLAEINEYAAKKTDILVKKANINNPVHLVLIDFNNLWGMTDKFNYLKRPTATTLFGHLRDILLDADDSFSPDRLQGHLLYSKNRECDVKSFKSGADRDPIVAAMLGRFVPEMNSDRKRNGGDHGFCDVDVTLGVRATEAIVRDGERILSMTIVSGDGDFTSVIEMARRYGVFPIVISFREGISDALRTGAGEVHYMNDW
jgi:hypothetical protein